MKAVVQDEYGPPDEVLHLREVAEPSPKDNEVLVRVRAASMHADVWHVIVGYPIILRLIGNGVRKPKFPIPGTDLAGVVQAVGKAVTRFKIGDEVFGETVNFGWQNGAAYAEYATAPQDFLAHKPGNVSFEQAAAVPTAGMIALSNLGGAGRPKGGRSILINGAGGSMGSLALQIAKADGARVTAVDCAEKLPMLLSLGADRVIDYRQENYLQNGERYDFIMDVVAIRSPNEYKHALAPKGTYIPIGHAHYNSKRRRVLGDIPYFVLLLLRGLLDPGKRRNFQMPKKLDAMEIFRALLESGELTPVIGKTFPLSEVRAAMQCMIAGNTPGRIVVIP